MRDDAAPRLRIGAGRQPHVLKQSKRGAESYSLQLSDRREFHFRPGTGGHRATTIDVYDRFKNGRLVAELTNHDDVWEFFDGLSV